MWKKVLFSDEFSVRRYWIWRLLENATRKSTTTPTVKHPPSQMIWGAMSSMGTNGLYFLPPGITMNGEKYVNLFKNKLERRTRVHNCKVFMHDDATCHRGKVVKKFLMQKRYPNVGVARKQSGFESDRKLVEPDEE